MQVAINRNLERVYTFSYQQDPERKVAPVLHAALLAAKEAWNSSDCKQECLRKAESIISQVQANSKDIERKLDYIQFNHWQSFDVIPDEATNQSLAEGEPVILSGALWVGKTRLIDNIILGDDSKILS